MRLKKDNNVKNKSSISSILKGCISITIMVFFVMILFSVNVLAYPPLPTEFYGKVQFFNYPATPGTTIKAYDYNNNLCGTFKMTNLGYYGVLSCSGDNSTQAGSSPTEGQPVTFKIGTFVASMLPNDVLLETPPDVTWNSGQYKYVTLVAPVIVCGDGFCDNYESCSLCSTDCGACPGGGGSSSGGSSTTEVSSSASGSSGSGNANANIAGSIQAGIAPEAVCEESWTCLEWSECYVNGTKERSCADLNSCGTVKYKPPLVENCSYVNTTKLLLENVTNQTINETPSKPKTETPGIISVCENKLDLLSLPSLIFILLFVALMILSYVNMKLNILRLKKKGQKNDKTQEVAALEKEFLIRKETYIFMIVISVISIIVYFYHFFFFLCEDKYLGQLWFLGILILLAPLLIHFIISIMKYEESEKLARLKVLKDTHYQHFQKMMEITNSQLLELENKIIKSIALLELKDEFHDILQKSPQLLNIYKDMNKLFEVYKSKKNSPSLERDLLFNIDDLSKEIYFNQAIEQHPELADLRDDLILLFNMYKTKQEIYDELYAIELEYEKEGLLKSKESN